MFHFYQTSWKNITFNKKVLLRERKRHTARCVANTPYVVLTGYPPRGGYPVRSPAPGGYPDPPGGYPVRYPPGGVPGQVPPPGGYPAGPDPPLPPLWTDKHLWKQYLPVVLRTRAVKKRNRQSYQYMLHTSSHGLRNCFRGLRGTSETLGRWHRRPHLHLHVSPILDKFPHLVGSKL